jgi:hypothetical protein
MQIRARQRHHTPGRQRPDDRLIAVDPGLSGDFNQPSGCQRTAQSLCARCDRFTRSDGRHRDRRDEISAFQRIPTVLGKPGRLSMPLGRVVLALVITLLGSSAAMAEWALAFGQGANRHWGSGSAYDRADQATARAFALAGCRQHGLTCRIIFEGRNGCVALAVAKHTNGYGSGRGDSLGAALAGAMQSCVSANPTGCEIKIQFCDRTGNFQERKTTAAERQAFDAAVTQGRLNRDQQRVRESMSPGRRPQQTGPACSRQIDYDACMRGAGCGTRGVYNAHCNGYCRSQFC